jgi:hypothetical protein
VFDPLAITLVIATNQAFKSKRKKKDDEDDEADLKPEYEKHPLQEEVEIPESYLTHYTAHDTIHDTGQVPNRYRPNTDQIKRVWDRVKKLRKKDLLPLEQTEEEKIDEPTALAFTPYEIEDLEETNHVEENNKKRLIYKK